MQMNKLMRMLLLLLFFLAFSFCLFQVNQSSISANSYVRCKDQTLILDAGHGGEDGGAVSVSGVPESGINLSIVLKMDQFAGLYGVHTLLIRTSDTSIADSTAQTLREKKRSDLYNRVAIVNQTKGAVLISVHQNNHPQKSAHGAQVFFHSDQDSQAWAQATQMLFQTTLGGENQRQATLISKQVYLMNHINCQAILVECGLLSNTEEDQLLQSDGYQSKIAAILMSSYLNHLSN